MREILDRQISELKRTLQSMHSDLDRIDDFHYPEKHYLLDQIKKSQSKLETLEAVKLRLFSENLDCTSA